MKVLHTESSNGWGGQEMRILSESIGMRERGHEIIMAVQQGGGLVEKGRKAGFTIYEIDFKRSKALLVLMQLHRIIKKEKIALINTHSSLDAWLGGIAGRSTRVKVLRTRHLSTPIRGGLNSFLLYNRLTDSIVTTSSGIISPLIKQAGISQERCRLVATGVEPEKLLFSDEEVAAFREGLGLEEEDCLVGTSCFVRSWKGIPDFMRAAHLLRDIKALKWVIIGGGFVDRYKGLAKELSLEGILHFTGHLENPYPAMGALDIFTLLSTANEGISQASLQAAYLQKPLITTTVGGLPEVCRNNETGLLVPPSSPKEVAAAVLELYDDPELRISLGLRARRLVENKFTMKHTLDQMEQVYLKLSR
ncbi:MAG: N-acetyl-alpha-D-glucosaminyl L-malate synthase [Chlamydiae bacterium]|nr:N-acetyl-alpha-D-glucosaminyl L-malate synthase [Chlamydiota bacterium]